MVGRLSLHSTTSWNSKLFLCCVCEKPRRMAPPWWCPGCGKDERYCILLLCTLPGQPVGRRAPLYPCDWRYHHKYIVMATGGMEDSWGASARPAGGPLLPRLGWWALLLSYFLYFPQFTMRLDSLEEGNILREVSLFVLFSDPPSLSTCDVYSNPRAS